jgi:hypothetical protein
VARLANVAFWTALCLVAFGCGKPGAKKPPEGPTAARIPAVTRFRPPADGLVTDRHVDRYIRVRRAARGRSEEEAAHAVGVDPEEFGWVRARIVEAFVLLDTAQVRTAAEGTYARTIASLREATKSVKDRETLRRMEEQIAALERERASPRPPEASPPAVAANARKLAPRRAELEAARP